MPCFSHQGLKSGLWSIAKKKKKRNLEAGVVMGADREMYSLYESYSFHQSLCFGQFYSLYRTGRLPSKWPLDICSSFSQARDLAALQTRRETDAPLAGFGQSKQSQPKHWWSSQVSHGNAPGETIHHYSLSLAMLCPVISLHWEPEPLPWS